MKDENPGKISNPGGWRSEYIIGELKQRMEIDLVAM